MTEQPWLIPPDGQQRFRYSEDRREVEVQSRQTLTCNGCGASVLTWPGEHERHRPLIQHRAGCRIARRGY